MRLVYLSISSHTRPISGDGSFLIHTRHRRHNDVRLDDDQAMALVIRGRDEENTQRTLAALERTRIKYPGKNDDEAQDVLDHIIKNWKTHKPKIASYWLVKLDSVKRKKVIDIVRGNVEAIVARVWRCRNVEHLRLTRLFNRVFNRMHNGRGQGLWNCFTTSTEFFNSDSWETNFSKSTDAVSDAELQCCRRIVRLSKDCLLIVFHFANEAKSFAEDRERSENIATFRASVGSRGYSMTSQHELPKRTCAKIFPPHSFTRPRSAASIPRPTWDQRWRTEALTSQQTRTHNPLPLANRPL
uniref:tubulin polyglutamylase TTLL7-like isoform X3 n=1 Tax=Ciona intestinalis TaxID=7719 RepID=UPI000EF45CF7|nr:tubulin polyglutamylase TTLL7-like isoform X3 [Ciona intestinalis]|eukprot:XP_026695202.1 tubulin polyglutamylase TTLL7-like isoform X3 [Ciona intestinalis]